MSLQHLSPFGHQLLWVIAALLLATLPHVPHLSPWIIALTALAATLRIACDIRRWALPPRWIRTLVAFGALLAVFGTYRTLNGVEAGTALLIVMAGMKLLETNNVRDLTVIVFLSYFAVFAAFLYNQSLLLLPYLLATAWLLTATLMRVHQTTLAMPAREAARLTGKMLLQALPFAIIMFAIFPRLPGNFWAIPARSQAMTGLSDEVSPGDVSELSISGALAFRVNFDGAPPPAEERYWRGPVMHEFDGRTWRITRTPFVQQTIDAIGEPLRYRITLEPHQRPWIFALDAVTKWPADTFRSADLQLLKRRGQISTLSSFELESSPRYRVQEPLPTMMRNAALRLPTERNPRTLELAERLRSEHSDDRALIAAVLRMFREQEYYYTLEPPRLEIDSVDDFLFNTRQGFCEHFASAFTVLARAAGIPARLVAGYQGGEFNPMSGYLVIRQSDAHAWSEVWLDGEGWVRVDPTAAVAPERIQGGIDAALSATEPVPGRVMRSVPLLAQARLAWDAANTFWNNQIVEFSESQQRWLANKMGFEDISWRWFGVALIVTFVAFFLALSAYLGWRFRSRNLDPVQQVYAALCRKLDKAKLPKLPHEGPNDYLKRIATTRPELAAALHEVRMIYVNLRYEPSPIAASLSRLKFLVNQLKTR